MSGPFPKGAARIDAGPAVHAKTAMTQEGNVFFRYDVSCQYAGQNQVQHRDLVKKTACGGAEDRYITNVGHHKHGAGKHGGATDQTFGPGLADPYDLSGTEMPLKRRILRPISPMSSAMAMVKRITTETDP